MVKIPTAIRYGVRMLITLAENDRQMNTNELSREMGVSPLYLRQVALPLEKKGVIRGTKGAKGGYSLNVDPATIDLFTIFKAMNEDFSLLDCVDCTSACERSADCPSRELWKALSRSLRRSLKSLTLKKLVENRGRSFEIDEALEGLPC